MNFNLPLLVTFIAYLLGILYVGIKAYRRTHDLGDYILGGRKLGSVVTALSVGASDMSGWLLLGLPGAIYLSGLSEVWIGVGLVIGAYCNWIFAFLFQPFQDIIGCHLGLCRDLAGHSFQFG